MNDEAVRNRQEIADIKARYITGRITREQAQLEAAPVIKRINEAIKRVSKRQKQKPRYVDFIGLMR